MDEVFLALTGRLVCSMVQPLLFMVLFGWLLRGATSFGTTHGSSWQCFVPGVLIMMCLLGFRLRLAGAPAGLALLVVFGIGLGGLPLVLAITAQPDGTLFWMVTQMLTYPLLLSGVLPPIQYGPGWLRGIAVNTRSVSWLSGHNHSTAAP